MLVLNYQTLKTSKLLYVFSIIIIIIDMLQYFMVCGQNNENILHKKIYCITTVKYLYFILGPPLCN